MNNKQIFKENELDELKQIIKNKKKAWKIIVWTNGCFDILHPGHLETFKKAKEIWDILIVWLNWDSNSYWKTKPWRPINDEKFRSKMLVWLRNVDYVYIFNDENPSKPVDELKPDYVLKWWDYYIKEIPEDFIQKIPEDKKFKIDKFNEIVEKELVKSWNWILDITWIYKYILENDLEEIAKKISWYMPEWLINVKNWWKVVLVSVIWNYSTTSIVEEIRPKEFLDLVMFFKKYENKFKDLKKFFNWCYKKLNINYFWKKNYPKKINQFSIYEADLWKNIWVESGKIRPVLILSSTAYSSKWEDVIIAPITDRYNKVWKGKKIYPYDILLFPSFKNWLSKESILRLWWIRQIDKKRILYYRWKLTDEEKTSIKEKLSKLFKL